MASQASKASKGTVGIERFRNKLRLRLPRTVGVDSRYISTGLEDTPENRKKAQIQAWEIESDIANGTLDLTLEKYKPQKYPHLTVVQSIKPKPALSLTELWERYTEYKAQWLEETTIKATYKGRIGNLLPLLPSQSVEDAVAIRDWLLANKSPYTTKLVLSHFASACDWGIESQLLENNPFRGMAKKIKSKAKKDPEDIDPFTVEERDAIIETFSNDRYYRHYTGFVKFLFLTGCRTGEAIALQWGHINPEMSQITFTESFSSHFKVRKDTKTHKSRKFPINSQLRELLESIKPKDCTPETLVFPSPTGKEIDGHNFLNRAWKGYKNRHGKFIPGIVTRLVSEGKVARYRCLYNTRHTFVTMAIEAGVSFIQVAKWVGNSPDIIMKHYAGQTRSVAMPEL